MAGERRPKTKRWAGYEEERPPSLEDAPGDCCEERREVRCPRNPETPLIEHLTDV
jgi:hypothetical protein